MSFSAYPEYRESGVEWLDKVPAHWQQVPLWTLFTRVKRTGFGGEELLSVYRDYGVIPKSSRDDNFNKASDDLSAYQLVEPGDLAINKMKAWQGSVAISQYRGIVSPAYHIYSSVNSESSRYLHHLFRSKEYISGYLANSKGIRVNQWDLEPQQHSRMPVLLPPLAEQFQIARFLDHETAKIDALIQEQERLIELLQEKRQAVISHAVTKGLDPDVPMKDSGVEWLGEVPAHWKVVRLKHVKSHRPNAFVDGPFGSNLKSSHFIEEGDAYVIESNFATTGRLENTKLKQISLEHFRTIQRSETQGGDIIIAKIGARYGMCSILPTLDKPAVVSGNSLKLTINQDICDPIFATLVLRYLRERGAIEDIVNMTAQPALSLGELNNLPFPLPSLAEQNEILVSVQGQLTKFTSLTEECSRVIHLLYERRSALISAAVTGKIDVRNWEPPADESAFGEEVRQAGMEATA